MKPMFAKHTRERMLATQNNMAGRAARANLPELVKGKAIDQAAQAVNVSGRIVQNAETILKDDPEEFEKIKSDRITANVAKRNIYWR